MSNSILLSTIIENNSKVSYLPPTARRVRPTIMGHGPRVLPFGSSVTLASLLRDQGTEDAEGTGVPMQEGGISHGADFAVTEKPS